MAKLRGFLDALSESVATCQDLIADELSPRVSVRVGAEDVLHATASRAVRQGGGRGVALPVLVGQATRSLTALKHLILEKTEGTPFFMEEVVQTLAEEGVLGGERGHYRLSAEAPPASAYLPDRARGVGGAHRPPGS